MSDQINHQRRHFLGIAAMTIAATQLGRIGSANAQSSQTKPAVLSRMKSGTNPSFGSLRQIDTGVLNVGYAEASCTTEWH